MYQDEMNQRYSGYIYFQLRQVSGKPAYDSNSKGPESVKFTATAKFDNNVYFSLPGIFEKKKIHSISTVYSLQHTHAAMSIHGEVSSKHMSVGGNKKKETY